MTTCTIKSGRHYMQATTKKILHYRNYSCFVISVCFKATIHHLLKTYVGLHNEQNTQHFITVKGFMLTCDTIK